MSNRLLSKPLRQSPVQESFSPHTSKNSFASFVTKLMLRSDDQEKDEIGKLQKDNDILKRENLQLRKELSKYKNDYTKTHSELKSLEKSAEGLCNCDYCDYVTNSYENIINLTNASRLNFPIINLGIRLRLRDKKQYEIYLPAKKIYLK